MIVVLMHEQDLTMQEAIDLVGDLCKHSIDTFEEVRCSLPSWGPAIDRNVQVYIDGLQNWIIGSLHWSFSTERSAFLYFYFLKRSKLMMGSQILWPTTRRCKEEVVCQATPKKVLDEHVRPFLFSLTV